METDSLTTYFRVVLVQHWTLVALAVWYDMLCEFHHPCLNESRTPVAFLLSARPPTGSDT